MSRPLFVQTLRDLGLRTLVLAGVTFAWGWLMVFMFTTFSPAMRQLVQGNPMFERFSEFASGNFFTLPGAITLGFQHPLLIAMIAVVAAGASAVAIAGEREAGTLELLLARPISRRRLYVSVLLAQLLVVALLLLTTLAGMITGTFVHGLSGEVALARMPWVFANGLLLWASFTAFGLAASVSFDRSGPALSLSLGWLFLHYFLEVLGSLWADARWTQDVSLIHRFRANDLLTGDATVLDFVVPGATFLVLVAYALVVFPRRDLAAPS
ncbi:MAG: ABC transporter permease subunit [Trueperaceae bacterium]|nr:ABC transporter permease subunit [Trueperaceae bacterium]